jgi:hypothetical protein
MPSHNVRVIALHHPPGEAWREVRNRAGVREYVIETAQTLSMPPSQVFLRLDGGVTTERAEQIAEHFRSGGDCGTVTVECRPWHGD